MRLNQHLEIPSIVSGYDLCPDKSCWNLVVGATVYNFLTDLGIRIRGWTGAGMPALTNVSTPYALIGGALYQRTVPQPRVVNLSCYVDRLNLNALQALVKVLEGYVAPNNATQQGASLKLRYQYVNNCGQAVGTALEMPCYYNGGLEGAITSLYAVEFPLQFIEYLPPSITELTSNTPALSFNQSLTLNFIAQRNANGSYSNMANGMTAGAGTGAVNALAYDASGNLYAAGNFATSGGVTTNQVAKWNGSAWSALGTGNSFLAAEHVNCIAIDQSGNVYMGGKFVTMGGVTVNNVAKWNGAAWSALGAGTVGVNDEVFALCFDASGNLIVGGVFTSAGGSAANKVAKWNGSAWSTLAPGFSGTVRSLALGLDGSIYAGGLFVTTNGGGTTLNGIGRWDGAAWRAMAGGTTYIGLPNVQTLSVGPDGSLYLAGNFSAAGGVTAANIAKWTGSGYLPLGPGLNNGVIDILALSDGSLIAGGNFTGTNDGALTFPDMVGKWNGSAWVPLDADLPGSPGAVLSIAQKNGVVVFGTDSSGSGTVAAKTTITNGGTAYARPSIAFTGPGRLVNLANTTTGKTIYFNYTLLAGEVATLDLNPLSTTFGFNSSFFGNVMGKIIGGSDLTTWSLAPGANDISILMTGTTGATGVVMTYKNTHWSFNAGS